MIKQVNTDDIEYHALLELRNRVLRQPLGLDIQNDDLLDEDECQHLGFFIDGEVKGCLKIKQLDSKTYQILQMAVLPENQGQGIGASLLQEAELLIKEQGGNTVIVEARDIAVPFYLKTGYQDSGKRFVKLDIPHQIMEKFL